jgi:hypothetical protein
VGGGEGQVDLVPFALAGGVALLLLAVLPQELPLAARVVELLAGALEGLLVGACPLLLLLPALLLAPLPLHLGVGGRVHVEGHLDLLLVAAVEQARPLAHSAAAPQLLLLLGPSPLLG